MCFAHEFWLQPRIFNPEQAGETPIDIRVGMNFEGDTWGGNLSRVHDIVYFHGDKQAKKLEQIRDDARTTDPLIHGCI